MLTGSSLRSIALIAGVLGRAGEMGNTRRKRDAKKGIVAWESETEVDWYMTKHYEATNKRTAEQDKADENASDDKAGVTI